jgi:catechol 2,3-dioxygenase-like lactoylglutathione lyase family enzyme
MNPPITGSITFFYYDDLKRAADFYQNTLGFQLVNDVDFAKVYHAGAGTHVGLVDGHRGSMKPTKDKPVMLSLFVDDVDKWHKHLLSKGLKLDPPVEPIYNKMRVLIFKDPEGYTLELLQWLTPYGK